MANDDMELRLVRWADWLMRSSGAGLGFPRECSYVRMVQTSTGEYASPDVDIESAYTEKAVQSLPNDFKLAVQVYYLTGGTRDQQANYLHCHVRTMERRVKHAQEMIRTWLDGNRLQRTRKKLGLPLDTLP